MGFGSQGRPGDVVGMIAIREGERSCGVARRKCPTPVGPGQCPVGREKFPSRRACPLYTFSSAWIRLALVGLAIERAALVPCNRFRLQSLDSPADWACL